MKMPVSILFALTATLVAAQNYDRLPRLPFPDSPCPLVFNYNQSKPDLNTWLGAITVSVNTPVHGLRLRVAFTEEANVLSSNFGEVWTIDNKDFTLLDFYQELNPKETINVWILVKFGDLDPVPHLHTVELNGKQICPPPIETLKHNDEQDQFPSGRQRQENNDTCTSKNQTAANKYNPKECGRIKIVSARGLILNSEVAPYGHSPWHAAIYQYQSSDMPIRYTGGGTLISPSLILTAGHCVSENRKLLNKDIFLINLGKYTSRATTEDGVQDKRVSEIHVYPLFENFGDILKHDIAIIKLATPATINSLVRPVCLWEKDKVDLNNVINKYGTVVGWGFGVENKLPEQLRQAKMPIVALETCLYTDRWFYAAYTSSDTYCAGSPPTGPTVCNGDSGGGMVFKKDEKAPDDETPWLLRGVVSLAKAHNTNNRCDPRFYVVFTDAAKYLDWISSFLEKESE